MTNCHPPLLAYMPETDHERNLRFAEAVKQALGGLPQREVRRRTGISATYVGDMLWGSVPSFRKLEQLARGLELRGDLVKALFESAGYEPPRDLVDTDPSPDLAWNRWLAERLAALVDEFPGVAALPMPVECVAAFGGMAKPLTESRARGIYNVTRKLFEEESRRMRG